MPETIDGIEIKDGESFAKFKARLNASREIVEDVRLDVILKTDGTMRVIFPRKCEAVYKAFLKIAGNVNGSEKWVTTNKYRVVKFDTKKA